MSLGAIIQPPAKDSALTSFKSATLHMFKPLLKIFFKYENDASLLENIDEKIEIVKENKLDILEWQVK